VEFFCDPSNPYYDSKCNNEEIKRKKGTIEQMRDLQGVEYVLEREVDPHLFIIRKQIRHSTTQVTPLEDYYVTSDGSIYQSQEFKSISSRDFLQSKAVAYNAESFDAALSCQNSNYNSKGSRWELTKPNSRISSKISAKSMKDEWNIPTMDSCLAAYQQERMDDPLRNDQLPVNWNSNSNDSFTAVPVGKELKIDTLSVEDKNANPTSSKEQMTPVNGMKRVPSSCSLEAPSPIKRSSSGAPLMNMPIM